MIFLCIPLVIFFGCLGGQLNKLFRPIGIPLSIMGVYLIKYNHPWFCVLPVLLYGFELTLGYGENSKLMKWFKDDRLVRLIYSSLCCIPLTLCVFLTGNYMALLGTFFILLAFQLEFGSWGKIGKYDVLGDDVVRWGILGVCVSFALL